MAPKIQYELMIELMPNSELSIVIVTTDPITNTITRFLLPGSFLGHSRFKIYRGNVAPKLLHQSRIENLQMKRHRDREMYTDASSLVSTNIEQ